MVSFKLSHLINLINVYCYDTDDHPVFIKKDRPLLHNTTYVILERTITLNYESISLWVMDYGLFDCRLLDSLTGHLLTHLHRSLKLSFKTVQSNSYGPFSRPFSRPFNSNLPEKSQYIFLRINFETNQYPSMVCQQLSWVSEIYVMSPFSYYDQS